jgi:predicted ABC-type transport system involved in lysophospholipase L1 biosynthesis ATPase subunit
MEQLWRDQHLTLVLVTAIAERAHRVAEIRNGRLSIREDNRTKR